LHSEEVPLRWHPLQLLESPILEPHLGPGHEVAHGARDEDLARARHGHDPSTHVHCDSADITTGHLYFPHVDAGPHLDVHACDAVNDRARALDGARGLAECGEESVARSVPLPASEAL